MSRWSTASSSSLPARRLTPKSSASYAPPLRTIGTIALPVRSPATSATSALYTFSLIAFRNFRQAFSAAWKSLAR